MKDLWPRWKNCNHTKPEGENKDDLLRRLKARGLVAQVTDEKLIQELIDGGKATFYIGFDRRRIRCMSVTLWHCA